MTQNDHENDENGAGDINNETLVACVQGELNELSRTALEAALAESPELQKDLAAIESTWLRLKKGVPSSLSPSCDPEALAQLIMDGGQMQGASGSNEVGQADQKNPTEIAKIPTPMFGSYLFRAAILVFGVALGWGLLELSGMRPERKEGETITRSEKRCLREGLAWLMRTQEESGGWQAEKWGGNQACSVGLTGLALKALVANGRSLYTADASQRAIDYLLSQQGLDGALCVQASGEWMSYNHSLATLGLLQAYQRYGHRDDDKKTIALPNKHAKNSPLAKLRQGIERALAYTQKMQQAQKSSGGDLATLWQSQVLFDANRQGFAVASGSLYRAGHWLSERQGLPNEPLAVLAFTDLQKRDAPMYLPETFSDNFTALSKSTPVSSTALYFLVNALRADSEGLSRENIDRLRQQLAQIQVKKGRGIACWEALNNAEGAGGQLYATAIGLLAFDA